MKTIKWRLSIGFPGAIRQGEVEVEDDATKDDIEELVRDVVFEYVDWNFWIAEDEVK